MSRTLKWVGSVVVASLRGHGTMQVRALVLDTDVTKVVGTGSITVARRGIGGSVQVSTGSIR